MMIILKSLLLLLLGLAWNQSFLSKDMRVCLTNIITLISREVILVRILVKIRAFLRRIDDIDA